MNIEELAVGSLVKFNQVGDSLDPIRLRVTEVQAGVFKAEALTEKGRAAIASYFRHDGGQGWRPDFFDPVSPLEQLALEAE